MDRSRVIDSNIRSSHTSVHSKEDAMSDQRAVAPPPRVVITKYPGFGWSRRAITALGVFGGCGSPKLRM
jgi:hypothetical protein